MSFWIPAWILVFATGMLVAILLDAENRRKNSAEALFMLAVMIVSGLLIAYH